MSLPITRAIVDTCRGAGACEAGLRWISAEPRTLAELHREDPSWAVWLATFVPDLGDAERDELRELTGARTWWRDGRLHRDDGPAVERPDGRREWWRDGQRHRADGPAIECADGYRSWYLDGQRHRDDGPAIERPDGSRSWWRDGRQVAGEEAAR